MTTEKETITISVNGRTKEINIDQLTPDGEISFQQVLDLASDSPGWLPPGPNIEYTVSFRNGAGRPPAGDLMTGGATKIQDGTVFIATSTDKS